MVGPLRGIVVAFAGVALVALFQVRSVAHNGQAGQAASSSESTEHDFDFLLGTWDFVAESKLPGVPPKYPGRWTGELTGAGALVEDDFIVTDDQGVRRYLGVTIRAFDAKNEAVDDCP